MEQSTARKSMIFGQVQPNKVNAPAIVNALAAVPREPFVPSALKGCAYLDENIEVAPGRFLMEPMILARLIDTAEIGADDLVLLVGCGAGYEAAVIGQLADAVVALEENKDLASSAVDRLQEAGAENVAVVEGDLAAGVPGQGPYQVIFVNGAVENLPQALTDQLADGGRLVAIAVEGHVGRGHIVRKLGKTLEAQNLFDTDGVVLPGFEIEDGFEF